MFVFLGGSPVIPGGSFTHLKCHCCKRVIFFLKARKSNETKNHVDEKGFKIGTNMFCFSIMLEGFFDLEIASKRLPRAHHLNLV